MDFRVRLDRRHDPRRSAAAEHGITSACVRPGIEATLVNVSNAGALVETGQRLLPGRSVELRVQCANAEAIVRGRVLRCSVGLLTAERVLYRSAIHFEGRLRWAFDGRGDLVPQFEIRHGSAGNEWARTTQRHHARCTEFGQMSRKR